MAAAAAKIVMKRGVGIIPLLDCRFLVKKQQSLRTIEWAPNNALTDDDDREGGLNPIVFQNRTVVA